VTNINLQPKSNSTRVSVGLYLILKLPLQRYCSTRVNDAHREARKISYHLEDKPFNGSLFSLELDHNTHAQSDVTEHLKHRPQFVVVDAATSGCGQGIETAVLTLVYVQITALLVAVGATNRLRHVHPEF
jgi:hypothetical protein